MILLDTNIVSELMRPKPNLTVIKWLDEQFSHELFISAIVKAEIEMGIAILDEGKRKQNLSQATKIIFMGFSNRCLPFDQNTTQYYANVISFAKIKGRPISVEDAQIAAITL